jgi:DNA (cytosine-5)-methyltransferase 1
MVRQLPTFTEFFSGGGLARCGLEGEFECLFANDIDSMKCAAYALNYPDDRLRQLDVWRLRPGDVPDADLAWASFPCQDVSFAGARRGLNAPRTGAFWGLWNLIEGLDAQGRAPATLALENVPGLLTTHRGRDFSGLVGVLADAGYRVGALLADAAGFTAQSRPRLFIIAHRGGVPDELVQPGPDPLFHTPNLRTAVDSLPSPTRMAWIWWRLPHPPIRNANLADVVDRQPPAEFWSSPEQLAHLLSLMSPLHRRRVDEAVAADDFRVGAAYRRIRVEAGVRRQRAEVRYDGLAGCLRTPGGGSSRQFLLISEGGEVRLRRLLPREAARLMGCPEHFRLPSNDVAALKVLGDGVSPPVVRWLGRHLLAPLAKRSTVQSASRKVRSG